MLAVMDEISEARDRRYHNALSRGDVVPVKTAVDDIFGFFSNRGRITGDVVSPALSPDDWGELQ
jgi:hypothetical protein